MVKNIQKYYQAWKLRRNGSKLHKIAQIMGFKSGENARRMIAYIDFKIASNQTKSNGLKKLIFKYGKGV